MLIYCDAVFVVLLFCRFFVCCLFLLFCCLPVFWCFSVLLFCWLVVCAIYFWCCVVGMSLFLIFDKWCCCSEVFKCFLPHFLYYSRYDVLGFYGCLFVCCVTYLYLECWLVDVVLWGFDVSLFCVASFHIRIRFLLCCFLLSFLGYTAYIFVVFSGFCFVLLLIWCLVVFLAGFMQWLVCCCCWTVLKFSMLYDVAMFDVSVFCCVLVFDVLLFLKFCCLAVLMILCFLCLVFDVYGKLFWWLEVLMIVARCFADGFLEFLLWWCDVVLLYCRFDVAFSGFQFMLCTCFDASLFWCSIACLCSCFCCWDVCISPVMWCLVLLIICCVYLSF